MIQNTPISSYMARANTMFAPITATIELTLRCNLKCQHCYNFDRSKTIESSIPDHKELDKQQILTVIDEVARTGALFLSFTGGEPLIHPHIFEFIKAARQKHMAVKLKTNATFISEEVAARLKELCVQDFDVSLYGHRAEMHDEFTKKKGSFAKTMRGLENLKAMNMLANISFILNKINYRYIKEMKNLSQQLGFRSAFSTELTSRNDGSANSKDLGLTAEELDYIYKNDLDGMFTGHFNKTQSVQCACAVTNLAVAANGDVYPCIGAPIKSGSVLESSLDEIWKNSPQFKKIRDLKLKDFSDCNKCADQPYCQRSSGAVYVNTGNYTGSDPWTCKQAELLRKHHKAEA